MSNQRFQIKDPTVIIADAYHFAALQPHIWMSKVTTILEVLRKEFSTRSIYDVWIRWQQPEEGGYPMPLLKTLVQLKRDSYQLYLTEITAQLQAAFKENEEQAWSEFIAHYTQAINNWQTDIAENLCRNCLKHTHQYKSQIEAFQQLNVLHCALRWVECMPFYMELKEHPALNNEQKALLEATIGQIRLYYLDAQPDVALIHFNKAAELAPELARTERSFGEVKLKSRVFDEARQHFFKAIEKTNADSEMYLYIGDSYKDDLNLSAAENWYKVALKINPLDANYNARIIRLYGEPSLINQKQATFVKELEMAVLLEPDAFYNNTVYNIHRDIAAAYQLNQKNEEAIQWYKKAIELNPDWIIAWIDLGYTYFYMNQFEPAETHFKKAIALAPEAFDGHWAMAILYDQQKKYDKAIAAYEKCIELRPEWEHTIRNTEGVLLNDDKHYDKAIEKYKKAVELQPDVSIYHDNLAQAFQTNKQFGEAEKEYELALQLDPDNYGLLNRLGIFYYNQKNYKTAVEYYQKAIDLHPSEYIYYDNLGLAYSDAADWNNAETAYKKAIELVPQDAVYINSLGVRYYGQSQYEKSIEYYEKATAINPLPLYFENIGLSYELLKNTEKAEKAYLKALDLTEKNAQQTPAEEKARTYNCLGVFYDNQKDMSKAIDFYRKAMDIMPETKVYQTNLAGAYENNQDWHEAIAIYQKQSKKEPKNDNYHNRLAYCFFQLKEYDQALKHLETALKLRPDMAIYHENIGYFNDALGHYEEALKSYEKAVELEPDKDYRYSTMSSICRKLKNIPLAIHYLEKAILINPRNADYYNDLGVLYFDNAIDDKKAIEYYKKAIELNPQSHTFLNNLGLVFETLKEYPNAQFSYEKAIEVNPTAENNMLHRLGYVYARMGDVEATENIIKNLLKEEQKAECYNCLGIYFYEQKDNDKALEYYEIALGMNPLPVYYDNIGLAYEGEEKWADAAAIYEKLIKIDPTNDVYHNRLVHNYFQLKDYEKVLLYVNKTIELQPQNAVYCGNLAYVYTAMEQYQDAIKAYEKAIQLDPGVDYFYNYLGDIYQKLNDLPKAQLYWEKALALTPDNPDSIN